MEEMRGMRKQLNESRNNVKSLEEEIQRLKDDHDTSYVFVSFFLSKTQASWSVWSVLVSTWQRSLIQPLCSPSKIPNRDYTLKQVFHTAAYIKMGVDTIQFLSFDQFY